MAEPIQPRTELLTGHTVSPDVAYTPGKWTVTVDATGGTFTLTIGGQTTAAIAFNAAASAVATALNNLDAVSGATVTGGPGAAGGGTPYTIVIPDIEGTGAETLTASGASLTGGAATATVAVVTAPAVQARHDTTVITDPTDTLAVQTPIAQQKDGLAAQVAASPKSTFGW